MEQTFVKSRVKTFYLSVIISISLILFSLGLLALLIIEARNMSNTISENFQISLFINDGSNDLQIMELKQRLQQEPYTKNLIYVSKAQALDSLIKELGEGATALLDNNPLPASLDLFLKAEYATADQVKNITEQLQTEKIIQEVAYQRNELAVFTKNMHFIGIGILAFSALLFIICLALINNTVRLAVHSRRFLIKSMQLVGATKNFIVMPFMGIGLRNGMYGGFLACILLAALLYVGHKQIPDLIIVNNYQILVLIFGTIVVLGVLISVVSTYISVRRFLRIKIDELYY